MNIGKLRHYCKLYSKDVTRNPEDGSSLEQYTFFANTYADIIPVEKGRELYFAETINSEVSHVIVIRYIRGVKPDMILKYDNVTYEVKSVVDKDIKHETLILLATTGVSNV